LSSCYFSSFRSISIDDNGNVKNIVVHFFSMADIRKKKRFHIDTSNVKTIVLVNPIGMSKPHIHMDIFFFAIVFVVFSYVLFCRSSS
jgi:hypothetical protein